MRRAPPFAAFAAAAACFATGTAGQALTDTPGDPARGREIVADRARGLCILCHAAPLPEVGFMGDLGPDLSGVGSRLTVPELRARIVDSRQIDPDSIMPPYHSLANLERVGEAWRGATILTAQEVEDVVAYLATLTGEGDTE